MNFGDSLDEEEPLSPMTSDENNKDYMEPCDFEVNDILPRFQRLHIDDELQELQPEITNNPCTSTEKNSRVVLWSSCEDPSMLDSSVKLSPETYGGVSGEPSEVTEATTDKEQYFSVAEKITGDIWAAVQINNQSRDIIQKATSLSHMHRLNQKEKKLKEAEEIKLNEEENVLDKSSLNPCLIHKLDHNYAAKLSSTAFENKTEPVSKMTVQRMDLETDEILNTSSNILKEKGHNEGAEHTNETASNKIVDLESPRVSYSADVSSDDQSNMNCDVKISSNTLDSSLKDKALVEAKRKRKTPILVPSVTSASDLQTNQIRQRRFNIFQSPTSNTAESQIRRNLSTSDEYLTNTSASDLQTNQIRQRLFSFLQSSSFNIDESEIPRNISTSDEVFINTSASDLQMNQIRQRNFSMSQSPSTNIVQREIRRNISTSDEDSKNTSSTGKRPHTNSKKRRQKNDKSLSERESLIHSNEKTEEKNRSSVSKRKISTAEVVQLEKVCKRSISEKNSKSSKKPHLKSRSRSKSSSQ